MFLFLFRFHYYFLLLNHQISVNNKNRQISCKICRLLVRDVLRSLHSLRGVATLGLGAYVSHQYLSVFSRLTAAATKKRTHRSVFLFLFRFHYYFLLLNHQISVNSKNRQISCKICRLLVRDVLRSLHSLRGVATLGLGAYVSHQYLSVFSRLTAAATKKNTPKCVPFFGARCET